MDLLLASFLRWYTQLAERLAERGHWCGAVDPRSGRALAGAQGESWSEVTAAAVLLGYPIQDTGVCPIVLHPIHGTASLLDGL